jgi:copper transport protein
MADDSIASAWTSSAGFATLLRAVAGAMIAIGLAATTTPLRTRARALSAAARAAVLDGGTGRVEAVPAVRRWRPDRSSAIAFVGVGLAVVSFWFDGHTVTMGVRVVHSFANSVHVIAGSVWVGGVVTMAAVLWSRDRAGRPSDALGLVVRFSAGASVALGAVVAAGLVMAIAILDSFGEITSTEWGQTFLLKSAAASIAVAVGAYNHFRLMPALERDPDDQVLHRSVRSTVTAEAIMLGFVVVVTAWLVVAAI